MSTTWHSPYILFIAICLGSCRNPSASPEIKEEFLPIVVDTLPAPPPSPAKIYSIGDSMDSYKGVPVYYNGAILHVKARNLAADGYNLGLEYQCVEFVKRFYYTYYKHKMPYSYGDAKDFYQKNLGSGAFNPQRGMYQYQNFGTEKPQPDDIVVWKGDRGNPYGHVAIVSDTSKYEVEIIQQNGGADAPSRIKIPLVCFEGKWKICGLNIVGWLRLKK
jgi:surface antigen